MDACTYTSSIEPENDRVPRTIESENDRAREQSSPLLVLEYQAFSGHARNLAHMAEYVIRAMPQTVFSGDAALFLHDVFLFQKYM